MVEIKSVRAKKLLENLKFVLTTPVSGMRKYPSEQFKVQVLLEWDQKNVKNLSFFGELEDFEKIILESMAHLLVGKNATLLETLSARECEAFLRDRNSELALAGMSENIEKQFKSFFLWLRSWPAYVEGHVYRFSSEKGPFKTYKLVDKIKELKAFLNSPEILTLYGNYARPELMDVEDLTVYIQAPYESSEEKSLFEELHVLGVEAFQEENLNFIPEV